ncbi:hypothetical protein STANM309S_03393 [Streptomyces tanashiensis]
MPAAARAATSGVSGPSAQSSAWPSVGRWAARRPTLAASEANQAAEVQPSPIVVTAGRRAPNVPAEPPQRAGTKCRAKPAARIGSTTSGGSLRSASEAAACLAAVSAASRTVSGDSDVGWVAGMGLPEVLVAGSGQ